MFEGYETIVAVVLCTLLMAVGLLLIIIRTNR